MQKKYSPFKRARRRLRSTIKRLKREIVRLQLRNQQLAILQNPGMVHCQAPDAAMIYSSELEAVRNYVQRYPVLETGGSLFGWYSESGLPVIALATGPGKNAMHEATRFHADEAYSFAMGNAIAAHGLQHLAEWHSHHRMSLSHPSGIDCNVMQEALAAPSSSPRRFLCGIANISGDQVTLNIYYFCVERGREYSHVPLVVKNGISPVRSGLKGLLETMEAKGG